MLCYFNRYSTSFSFVSRVFVPLLSFRVVQNLEVTGYKLNVEDLNAMFEIKE